MKSNLTIQVSDLVQLAEFFKVLSDPTRVKLLIRLFQQEACVGELAEELGATQSAVSHQLSVLKSGHLVKKRREGKQIYYALLDDCAQTVIETGQEYILKRSK